MREYGLDSSGSGGRQLADPFDHGNEPYGFTKGQ